MNAETAPKPAADTLRDELVDMLVARGTVQGGLSRW